MVAKEKEPVRRIRQDRSDLGSKLLRELQIDNARTDVDLAELFGVTPRLVGDRRQRLRDAGFIRKDKSVVDYRKLGLGVLLIILVSLKDRKPKRSHETAEWASKFRNVQEVHHVTGVFDMVVKLRMRDIQDQRAFLEHMAIDGNWDKTETMVVTGTVRESTEIEITEIEAAIIDGPPRRRNGGEAEDGLE